MNDFKLKKSTNMLANQFLTGFTANSSNGNDAKSLPINLSELTKNTQQAFKNSGQCSFVDIGKVLLQASKDGDTTKVHECMKNGAPFTTDWLGTSPLHFAAKYNHVETCATLLRAGISKDAKTKVDRTPLHFAVYEGHYEVVKLLLSANCDIEQIDMLKMTPLHWAVEKCHYGIVELLLERGANRNTVSKFGKTPYSMARQKGDVQLMRLFDMYGQSSKKDTRDATDSVMMEIEQQKKKDESDLNQFKHHENLARKETISSKRQKLGSTSSIDSIDEANNIAFKLLKDHGIQMLQNDDELDSSALIQNALQGGRKIVLSEAGKLIMNDTKLNRFLKVPFNTTITTSNVPPLSPTFGNPPLSPLLGRNPPPSPLLLHPSRIPPPHSPLSRSAPPSSPLSRNPPPSPLARNPPEPLHISKNIPNRNPTPTRKSDTPDTPTFQVSLSDDEINGAANLKQNDKNAMKLNSFFKPYSLSDQVQDLTSNRSSTMSAIQHLQLPIKPSASKNDIHKKLYVPKNKMNLFENNLKLKNSVVGNSHARRHHSTSSLSPTSEDSLISTEFVEPTTPRTPQHLNSSDLEMLIDKKFKELQHGYTELKQNFEREQQKSEGYRSQLVQLQKDFEMYKIQQQDKFDSLLKLLASRSGGGTDDDYNNYSNMIEENNGMDLTS